MRPVTITPATGYKEVARKGVMVGGSRKGAKKRTRTVGMTADDVIQELVVLLTTWEIDGKCAFAGGKISFADGDDREWYDELLALLNSSRLWSDARRELIARIGQYCSFCESPIFSHLHIEHVLPKSIFPETTLTWTNFLLACASCNSVKGNKPNHETFGVKDNNDAAVKAANKILWPHHIWTANAGDPFPFSHSLRWVQHTYGGRVTVKDELTTAETTDVLNQFREGTVLVDHGMYYLPAGTSGREKHHFGLIVSGNSSSALREEAQQLVDLVGLNQVVPTARTAKTVDRRVLNRTKACLRAMALRQQLDEAWRSCRAHLYPAVLAQAETTIRNTGFWSVWLKALATTTLEVGGAPKSAQEFLHPLFSGTSANRWTC